ncbi:MFS transporter [Polymorphospora sp. NPDC051019]|uniref:MFS transporter n=1 Tax=Polymorphospora sp. NPDC051019 TaxID=3155725 RepID=UPI003418A193
MFTHPVLRRILPGFALSSLGDGMAVVAVPWLALELAPADRQGTWVAVAVAAYTLPAAAGAVLFGRWLRRHGGARLAGWDAVLRAGALGAIPVAHLLGALTIGVFVALLALSALLHSWGTAGRYTLLAQVLPARHHLAANALLTTLAELAIVLGPPVGAALIGGIGAVGVLAVDALTFAVLALTYRWAIAAGRASPAPVGAGVPEAPAVPRPEPAPAGASGWRTIRSDPRLLGLLLLSFGFFALYGPIQVALPLHVSQDLGGSAGDLAAHYTAFGAGAVAGGLVTGYLRRWPLWPLTVGIVVCFGLTLLPLGLGAPPPVALAGFALAGLSWGPYLSTSMALFQRVTPPESLSPVLAANGAVTVVAVPLGVLAGGPLTALVGARSTLLLTAVGTLLLGLVALGYTVLRCRAGRIR